MSANTWKVDFYRVDSGIDCSRSLDLLKNKSIAERFIEVNSDRIVLSELQKYEQLWFGCFKRKRGSDLPSICDNIGSERDIDLKDGEWLGENTAFLYSPSLNVIAIESNMHGASAYRIKDFFKQFLSSDFEIARILKKSAYDELVNGSPICTRLSFKVAKVGKKYLSGMDLSTKNLLSGITSTSAVEGSFLFRAKKKKKPLKCLALLRDLVVLSTKGENVKSLKLTYAADNDSPSKSVDLLEECIDFSTPKTTVDKASKHIDFNRRKEVLEQAWREKHEALKEVLE